MFLRGIWFELVYCSSFIISPSLGFQKETFASSEALQ